MVGKKSRRYGAKLYINIYIQYIYLFLAYDKASVLCNLRIEDGNQRFVPAVTCIRKAAILIQ